MYVKNFSSNPGFRRNVMTGANEKRLYMNWQSGSLRKTDHQLFKRAGINTQGAMVLHFYPSSTENMLAKLEKEFRNPKRQDDPSHHFLGPQERERVPFPGDPARLTCGDFSPEPLRQSATGDKLKILSSRQSL
ncbi:MAG: hypothetical protein CM1200mP2_35580 [Planctomycetaceae bacterium]|nr:MAG: hypothetical protein CM1200mP2_35580 [Planctomycetaceae bacterium]